MSFRFRRAEPADLTAILALDRTYSPVYAEKDSYARLLDDKGLLLIAEDRGGLSAFAALHWVLDEATLLNLVVAPVARGEGVAKELLCIAIKHLRGASMRRILLEVRESNTAARRLYASFGFREDGRREGYYPGQEHADREAAILMSKTLDSQDTAL